MCSIKTYWIVNERVGRRCTSEINRNNHFQALFPTLLISYTHFWRKSFSCIDVLSAFPGLDSFAPPMLAAWHHTRVFRVDSSRVLDRLLSSAPGWREPPWDVPWVRKQGRRGGGVLEKDERRVQRKSFIQMQPEFFCTFRNSRINW